MALLKPIGQLISAPLKALGIVSTPGKPPTPLRPVTRDDAAASVAAADIITGTGGAEAPLTGGKLTLG